MSSRERLQYKRALQNLRRERLYGNPMTLEEAKSNKNKTILEQGEVLRAAGVGAALGADAGAQVPIPGFTALGAISGAARAGYNALSNQEYNARTSSDKSQLQQQLQTARAETTNQLQQLRTQYETAKQQLEQQNQQLQQQLQQLEQQNQQLQQENQQLQQQLQQLEQQNQQNQQLQQQLQQVRRQLQQARRTSRTATPAATPAVPEPNVINPVASVGGPKLPPPVAPGPQRITERRSLKDYL